MTDVNDPEYLSDNAPPKGGKGIGGSRQLELGVYNNYYGFDNEGEMPPDRAAVDQFIKEYLVIYENGPKDQRRRKSEVFEIFDKWVMINDFNLTELDPSTPTPQRKKALSDLIQDLTGVDIGRPKIDNSRPKAYYGMDLSKLGKYLEVVCWEAIERKKC